MERGACREATLSQTTAHAKPVTAARDGGGRRKEARGAELELEFHPRATEDRTTRGGGGWTLKSECQKNKYRRRSIARKIPWINHDGIP